MNNTSHAVKATQPLTTGNEGNIRDVHFCVDLALSHSVWPVCCLTLLILTVVFTLECPDLLICLQLKHHLIGITAMGGPLPDVVVPVKVSAKL